MQKVEALENGCHILPAKSLCSRSCARQRRPSYRSNFFHRHRHEIASHLLSSLALRFFAHPYPFDAPALFIHPFNLLRPALRTLLVYSNSHLGLLVASRSLQVVRMYIYTGFWSKNTRFSFHFISRFLYAQCFLPHRLPSDILKLAANFVK